MTTKQGFSRLPHLFFAVVALTTPVVAQAVTLEEAYRAALTKNETVLQNAQLVVQAGEHVKQARSGVLPSLSIGLTHLIQAEPSDPIAREFSPRNQTTASISLSQPVFRGFREFAGIRQEKELLSAQRSTERATQLDLYENIASRYLGVLSLEQDLRNLNEQAVIYDKRIHELHGNVGRGETNQTELLTAQATQAAVLAESRVVQSQLLSTRQNFEFLTHLPANSEFIEPAVAKDIPSPEKLDTYLARIDKRPDIHSAIQQAEAADAQVSVQWGAHLPSADAMANYYLKRPGFLEDIKWDVQLTVSMPIFQGGAISSKVREAVSQQIASDLQLQKMRRQANEEIRSLHANAIARADQVDKLKRAVELSEKNTAVVQRDYRLGLTRGTDVQVVLVEYRVQRRAYDHARYDALMDLIRLQVASVSGFAGQIAADGAKQ